MTYDKACDLFYNNEKVQAQFDFWTIDNLLASYRVFIDTLEDVVKELGIDD